MEIIAPPSFLRAAQPPGTGLASQLFGTSMVNGASPADLHWAFPAMAPVESPRTRAGRLHRAASPCEKPRY
jgi:hypothetical protein